MKYLLYL